MRKFILKKTISVILSVLMIFMFLPSLSVYSQIVDLPVDDSIGNEDMDQNVVKGVCGIRMNLTWRYNTETKVLTIKGKGEMKDRTPSSSFPWSDYIPYIETVVIENGVTKIGNYAFYGCTSLETIIFCGTESEWEGILKGSEWKPNNTSETFHSYAEGVCALCGFECPHETIAYGYCSICGAKIGTVILGDVNGDGKITNSDILAIYRYIYDSELYPIDIEAGDVDSDGEVTNADVLVIHRYIFDSALYPIP